MKAPGQERQLVGVGRQILDCVDCPLHKTRNRAVLWRGHGSSGIMFVGEAPGEQEDLQGKPFVGPSGHLLDKLLDEAGIEHSEVFITNVLKCRPPGNRDPKPEEAHACMRHLRKQIDAVQPKIIVTLGKYAAWYVTGHVGSMGALLEVEGLAYDNRIPVVPLYHPSYLLRQGGDKVTALIQDTLDRIKKAKALVV